MPSLLAILHRRFTASLQAGGSVSADERRVEGIVRKVGWLMVGVGFIVAVAGHYAVYSAHWQADPPYGSAGWAVAGLCLALGGLLLIQSRS
jgi:hypothetical protein